MNLFECATDDLAPFLDVVLFSTTVICKLLSALSTPFARGQIGQVIDIFGSYRQKSGHFRDKFVANTVSEFYILPHLIGVSFVLSLV